jgi:crossover junction endodeoxyribonuclease RusA
MLVLNLPLPPSINSYWGFSGHRRFINKAGIAFKEAVADYVAEYRVPKLSDARLEIHVTLYPKDKRIQDIDNRLKSLFDSLSNNGAGVFDDDSQIDVLFVQRGAIKKGGGCLVMIEILEDNVVA